MRLAATAADRAATAMEQRDIDIVRIDDLDQRFLGVLQRPPGGCEAAVFIAVGVADHDHLSIVASSQVFLVQRHRQNRVQNFTPVVEVVDRLQQRRNIERYVAAQLARLSSA